MRIGRILRGSLILAVVMGLAACASLPTTGDVRPGLAAGPSDSGSDVAYLPQGPSDGMTPEQVVRGFIDAASSPKDSWGIAREFLTSTAAQKWRPDTGVTIDTSLSERRYQAPEIAKQATTTTVRLSLRQTASVDENVAYATQAASGSADLDYALTKSPDGQWRISTAPDGIVLDAQSFADGDVFASYALQYYDPTWTYLVPDVRWFPKRENTASRIVQSLVSGKPSAWLTGGVRTAFTGDIALARNTVTPESQVAEVALTDAATNADVTTVSRMRTQLERSLAGVGVSQVKLTAGGRDLTANAAAAASTTVDPRPLVRSDKGFGFLSNGELVPIPGVSTELAGFPKPVSAIRASSGAQRVAVQTGDGAVYAVTDGKIDEIDGRPGQIAPTLDPFGFIWTAQAQSAASILRWSPSVESRSVPGPDGVSQISAMAMSRDGSRLAMAVTVNGQNRIEVASVSRDDRGAPAALNGSPTVLAWPSGGVADLTWLDDSTVGALAVDGARTELLQLVVGGPATAIDVPDGAASLAPSAPSTSIRLLTSDGGLFRRSVASWQREATGISVLAVPLGG